MGIPEARKLISDLVEVGVTPEYLVGCGISKKVVAMTLHELGYRLPPHLSYLAPPALPDAKILPSMARLADQTGIAHSQQLGQLLSQLPSHPSRPTAQEIPLLGQPPPMRPSAAPALPTRSASAEVAAPRQKSPAEIEAERRALLLERKAALGRLQVTHKVNSIRIVPSSTELPRSASQPPLQQTPQVPSPPPIQSQPMEVDTSGSGEEGEITAAEEKDMREKEERRAREAAIASRQAAKARKGFEAEISRLLAESLEATSKADSPADEGEDEYEPIHEDSSDDEDDSMMISSPEVEVVALPSAVSPARKHATSTRRPKAIDLESEPLQKPVVKRKDPMKILGERGLPRPYKVVIELSDDETTGDELFGSNAQSSSSSRRAGKAPKLDAPNGGVGGVVAKKKLEEKESEIKRMMERIAKLEQKKKNLLVKPVSSSASTSGTPPPPFPEGTSPLPSRDSSREASTTPDSLKADKAGDSGETREMIELLAEEKREMIADVQQLVEERREIMEDVEAEVEMDRPEDGSSGHETTEGQVFQVSRIDLADVDEPMRPSTEHPTAPVPAQEAGTGLNGKLSQFRSLLSRWSQSFLT